MFAASRYVAILVIVLSTGNKKVISKPVQYNLQTDAESADYFTILNIYDWFYSILNEDDDGDMSESEENYLICRNCTIVVQQSGSATSSTPPRAKTTAMLYNNKTVNIQTVENSATETKNMKSPEGQPTPTNMETSEIVQLTATNPTTVSQEG